MFTVEVYLIPLDTSISYEELSEEELLRGKSIKSEKARKRFYLGRTAVRCILATKLRLSPKSVCLCSGSYGKPMLQHESAGFWEFNIAHAGELVVVAVSEKYPVGVDIEPMSRDIENATASFFLTSLEYERYMRLRLPSKRVWVLRKWVYKEAVSKAIGLGLSLDFKSIVVSEETAGRVHARVLLDLCDWIVVPLFGIAGYIAAVSVPENAETVELQRPQVIQMWVRSLQGKMIVESENFPVFD